MLKTAVQARAALRVTVPSLQSASPLQLVKVEPVAGAAVRVTDVLAAKLALQVAPQVMPAGVEVTLPVPVPVGVTVRG